MLYVIRQHNFFLNSNVIFLHARETGFLYSLLQIKKINNHYFVPIQYLNPIEIIFIRNETAIEN